MYNGIMNTTGTVVPCPEELLEAIDKLDPLYKEDFDDMKKVCKEQKKRQARVKAPKLSQPSESVDAQPVDVVKDLAPPVQPEGEVIDKSPLESVPASSSGGGSDKPAEAAAAAAMKSPHIKSEPKLYTPVTLVELLPGRGSLPHVYLKRLPGERKQYQGFYPGLCIHQTKFVTQLDDQSSKARVTRQHSDWILEGLAEKQVHVFHVVFSYLQIYSIIPVRKSWREEKLELNVGRGSSNVEREGSFARGSEFHLDCPQGKK